MKKTDIAGTIGYLLRIHHGLFPGITFDPFEMSKMIDPEGVLDRCQHSNCAGHHESHSIFTEVAVRELPESLSRN